jgi:cell division transport system ATP-binding protein
MALIQFDNVAVSYESGQDVLSGLNFAIAPNSFQYLTGPSGAGKTTLLRMLFLALKPSRGHVSLFGHNMASLSAAQIPALRRRIGVVFQDFRLLDHLSTYDNVSLPLRVRGEDEASYRSDVLELLHWVGLGHRVDARPPVLSGGEKQRAAIARAVIGKPEILLADEPTGNVDPQLALRLLKLFVELHKFGTSVVIATHDLGLMEQYHARRLVLHEGRMQIYE